jgi:cytochrome c-type biogenesis protein CcmF
VIAETGLAALWLAAGLALLQLVLTILALRSEVEVARTMRAVAVVQGALTLIAFAALLIVFARTDLSVALVAENSHSAKPFIYKVAGAWGNHEGSMLMWVTILAIAGAFLALLSRRTGEKTLIAALGAQAALALGFYAFLLVASNPFARLNPAPVEGAGLNPLLQDPGLAFHPPTLYLGYVGLSIAFSLAVGALLTGQVDSRLGRAMRPWVLGAWVLLTLGITAGSYWAYYELGWGGYWFWDPVENASLMPWLAGTALLHSVTVLATRGALKAWTMMLAVIAFSMSMVGTFLVRSGILTSVHAFAIDPERGTFLLALLGIYVGAAFALFAWRGASLKEGAPFELVSRETGLVINNLLLSVVLGIVFLGTLYPLFVEALSGEKLSVGAPYFTAVAGPLALILALLVGIGPLLAWRRERRPVLGKLKVPALIGATALAITIILAPGMGILPRLGLTVAAYLAGASLVPLVGRNPLRAPLATWGMVVAHFGIAVALAGMAANSAFTTERLAVAKPGDRLGVGPWLVQLQQVIPMAGKNWTAMEGELIATRGSGPVMLKPQTRYFTNPPMETNEAAIQTFWNGQLYTVIGRPDASGGWQLRLWW